MTTFLKVISSSEATVLDVIADEIVSVQLAVLDGGRIDLHPHIRLSFSILLLYSDTRSGWRRRMEMGNGVEDFVHSK